jgi:hypothetical protein
MNKLAAFWNLFRKGECVADPALWKTHQVTANALAALFLAVVTVLKAFGLDVPLNEADALQLGGGVLVLVNIVLTLITSAKVGLLPAKAGGTDAGPAPAVEPKPAGGAAFPDLPGAD